MILAVDAQVRFSWIMLGREPRSSRELLMVYAGILAHGSALSAAETARMIPQLTAAAVRQAMKWASDERRLAEACRAFARTGNPDHAAIPHWPAFSAQTVPTMVFDNTTELVNNPDGDEQRSISRSA